MSHNSKHRALILIITVLVIMISSMQILYAAELPEVRSGKCGDNLTWTLSDDWTLTISGTGRMYEYITAQNDDSPWQGYSRNITKLVIEDGVTYIGGCAFKDMGITELVIPASVKEFGYACFDSCTSLQKVVLPEGLIQIPAETFARCSKLAEINIPESVSFIGNKAFYQCKSLTEIDIPGPVKRIENSAFDSCYGITRLTLPDTLEEIGEWAFYQCAFTELHLPETLTRIGQYAFSDCKALVKINIPRSVHEISSNAFRFCTELKEIVYEAEDIEFCPNALFNYSQANDMSLIITDSVKHVHAQVFEYSNIVSVEIGKNVESIGNYEFRGCNRLSTIVFNGAAPEFGTDIFSNVTATAYYPIIDRTWTEDVRQNYGGTITWEPTGAYLPTLNDAFVDYQEIPVSVAELTPELAAAAAGQQEDASHLEIKWAGVVDSSYEGSELVFYVKEADGTPFYAYRWNGVAWELVDSNTSQDGKVGFTFADFSPVALVKGTAEATFGNSSIVGANMTLGNELSMNFFVNKADIDVDQDYYITIRKTYADGRDDVTVTYPFSEWTDYNKTYYSVKFDNISAKEMNDLIYVQVFYADGTAATNVWEDSVVNYALRIFGNQKDATKSVLVDMLNYGAAAQEQFSYDVNNLANSRLTAEQKAYATQDVTATDTRIKGENYYGTNLNLGSNLQMSMFFNNIDQDMYAVVTFTKHTGEAKSYRIEGSEFVLHNAAASRYRIYIEQMVVADARQPITCTVYRADGTEVASATDSIESYIARMSSGGEIYEAILKFADSAYNYFHQN